jgi:tripeptide aminopeptidase
MSVTTDDVDESVVLETFLRLVRIDSPSGHERAVAEYLQPLLGQLGFEMRRDATGNLLGRRPGRGTGADWLPLILSAHMDTVQPGTGIRPLVQDGIVRSDGTTILGADDKAGIAAILETLRALDAAGAPCRPLELALTVEEETGLTGSKGLDMGAFQARQAVVLDSNGPVGTIVNQAPASDHLEAVIIGKAAHAGVAPETGINALVAAARALAEMRLGRIDAQTTANFGVISGGTATNIVPERVELHGEARSRDEAQLTAQSEHMATCLRQAAAAIGARADVTTTRAYGSVDVPATSPLIQSLAAAIRACGLTPSLQPTGGGSDANIFNAAGIAAVNLGVGYASPHSVDEHIAVADLAGIVRVLKALLTSA